MADLRVERQERLLSVPDPIHLSAVLAEETLRRAVGGTEVMVEQLDHLHKVAQLRHVRLQILPFAAGAAPRGWPFLDSVVR
ncbi:Scr1 family TA system antitoxin-like transcriptional regulator [Actinomadura citrea]|uniref:Scr1 family TA system antitoxin-like transcriptional regulator n=1 Tax=Actinomadura citrea TaxID=46158 RepID=UPI003570E50B